MIDKKIGILYRDAMQDCAKYNFTESNCGVKAFETAAKNIEIAKQVAAEENNGWIKCSDRLPEKHINAVGEELIWSKPVLFYTFEDECYTGCYSKRYDEWMDLTETKLFESGYVIAWQPLKPYKEI